MINIIHHPIWDRTAMNDDDLGTSDREHPPLDDVSRKS